MSRQFKAMQLSFAVHAVIVLSVIGISGFMITTNKTFVIDFSIRDSDSSGTETDQENILSAKPRAETKAKKQLESEIEESVISSPVDSRLVSKPESEFQSPVPAAAPPILAAKPSEKSATSTNEKRRTAITDSGQLSEGGLEGIRKKYLNENFAYIRDTVLKNLSYPLIARKMGWAGKVMLSFFISDDGSVKSIKVTQSSGIDVLDKNAIEAVKRAAPFPRPPAEAEVIIPIVYRLN